VKGLPFHIIVLSDGLAVWARFQNDIHKLYTFAELTDLLIEFLGDSGTTKLCAYSRFPFKADAVLLQSYYSPLAIGIFQQSPCSLEHLS
jgi:hypothetical protein